jgi:23S rRNA (cytidine1920-2'-O)/16S rRNA (cytidine1409-2'-O)-methyltransferase
MKERIDILLVKKKIVESRIKAKWLIKNGLVFVNNKLIIKSSKRIDNTSKILLKKDFPYVGLGGLKLEAALKSFPISVEGKTCADIGASIGGFTDCLLKHGASKIYVIDTATGLLHPSLLKEEKEGVIIPMLGVDARDSIPIEEKLDICTIDITFASIKQILPNVKKKLKSNSDIIALIKPVFEVDFYNETFNIVKDPDHLFQILKDIIHWNIQHGFYVQNIIRSPLLGRGGSIEFLIHLRIDVLKREFDYIKRVREIVRY